ncbi:MAG: hypothetical protein MZU79_05710 [Anaerotruncus sp.]|nr:hypothetical protein [Anaerotruncus sp.]
MKMAIALAGRLGAELAIGTDPDADRMGAAVRRPDGTYAMLTGNQIGCLLDQLSAGEAQVIRHAPSVRLYRQVFCLHRYGRRDRPALWCNVLYGNDGVSFYFRAYYKK